MLHVFAPLLNTLLGILLALFGVIHTLATYPGGAAFASLWASLPTLGSVGFFALGLVAVIVGLILLYRGIERSRRRWRQVRSAVDRPPGRREIEDEDEWEQRYAYR